MEANPSEETKCLGARALQDAAVFPGNPINSARFRGADAPRRFAFAPAANRTPQNFRIIACLVVLFFTAISHSQSAVPDPRSLYELRPAEDPNGIAKYFMGRQIAHVMGHQGADWLERPTREAEEHTDEMINLLSLKPGENVADIGAGTGYITWRMAKKIAPTGKVYAVEIQQEMLDLLSANMKSRGISNVVQTLGTVTDPHLPTNTLDLIIMVDVYHEFDHPYEMTEAMVRSLKTGGRLVFIEFRKEDPKVPIKELHKMSVAQVKKEMSVQQLQYSETLTNLPWQHVIIFKKTDIKPRSGVDLRSTPKIESLFSQPPRINISNVHANANN
jgi:precorrin-6B methylase 2